jgi:hypothetical protein
LSVDVLMSVHFPRDITGGLNHAYQQLLDPNSYVHPLVEDPHYAMVSFTSDLPPPMLINKIDTAANSHRIRPTHSDQWALLYCAIQSTHIWKSAGIHFKPL